MAKQTKSRRPAGMSKAQPRSYSELYGNRDTRIASPSAATTTATPARPKKQTEETAPQRGSDTVDWTKEYSQNLGDVRQLLVISAALFALMVVLGYVI